MSAKPDISEADAEAEAALLLKRAAEDDKFSIDLILSTWPPHIRAKIEAALEKARGVKRPRFSIAFWRALLATVTSGPVNDQRRASAERIITDAIEDGHTREALEAPGANTLH